MIVHKFDASGGFIVGNTATGLTSYAYPTSTHATEARRNARKVAAFMVGHERDSAIRADFDSRNWRDLGRNPDAPECFAPIDGVNRATGQNI